MGNTVVKIFVEGGLEASLYGLGTEVLLYWHYVSIPYIVRISNFNIFFLYILQLEFQSRLHEANSPLSKHIPDVLASGIIYLENGSCTNLSWDGKGVPDIIVKNNITSRKCNVDDFSFGVWGRKQFEYKNAGMPVDESGSLAGNSYIWPYVITKRCAGNMFADL